MYLIQNLNIEDNDKPTKKNFAVLRERINGNIGFTFHIKLFSSLSLKKNIGEMKKKTL